MKIIREACIRRTPPPGRAYCVLRTETYTSTFAHIERLVFAAREDFPDLDPEKIEVVKFGGQRYRRTIGIEFEVDGSLIPATYTEILESEVLL